MVVGDGWVKCYWAGGLSSVRGWKEVVGWVTCYLVKVRCWWRSGPHVVGQGDDGGWVRSGSHVTKEAGCDG